MTELFALAILGPLAILWAAHHYRVVRNKAKLQMQANAWTTTATNYYQLFTGSMLPITTNTIKLNITVTTGITNITAEWTE